MKTHQNILVAVDLTEEARQVLQRAIELAGFYKARLHLIHVVEPVGLNSPYELSPALPTDMLSALQQRAENFLEQLANDLQLKDTTRTVGVGSLKQSIFDEVKAKKVDLIVIGTHGRHGIELLLGSTATSVLHGTPCDVYAVRI